MNDKHTLLQNLFPPLGNVEEAAVFFKERNGHLQIDRCLNLFSGHYQVSHTFIFCSSWLLARATVVHKTLSLPACYVMPKNTGIDGVLFLPRAMYESVLGTLSALLKQN